MNIAAPQQAVVVTDGSGKKWWEFPDALWRRVPFLQRVRLRRTLSERVLPVLRRLEEAYVLQNPGTTHRIGKKSVRGIEKDDIAIEAALLFYELAAVSGLILFERRRKGEARRVKSESTSVGSCGLSVRAVRRLFLDRAVENIVKKARRRNKKLLDYLGDLEVHDVRDLEKVRLLVSLDPATGAALAKGLDGDLGNLLDRDDGYVEVLLQSNPIVFLRALRHALADDLPRILDWDATFLNTVAKSLDHEAKILALGRNLISIQDPKIVTAIGKWPVEERGTGGDSAGKSYVTRIGQVKKSLKGEFHLVLACSPTMIKSVGGWRDEDVRGFRRYLRHVDDRVMDALAPLPDDQKVGLLDGLWSRLGRGFIESHLRTPEGIAVIRNILAGIDDMAARGSAPKNLKVLIKETSVLDRHMVNFLEKT